jgi:hypothetical protein
LDEGLAFALIIPIFFILIPISISLVILYAILRDKKLSIAGSIIGLPIAFLAAYAIPVSGGEGIIWHLMRIDIVAASSFAPFIMAAFFGMLVAFTGLIATRIIVNVPKLLNRYLETLQRNEVEVNSRKKWDNIWILIFIILAAYLFYKYILPIFFSF